MTLHGPEPAGNSSTLKRKLILKLMHFVLEIFDEVPRRVFLGICLLCLGMLAFGVYLQEVVGLEPCPMCVVQRYAFILIALVAGLGAIFRRKGAHIGAASVLTVLSIAGAYVAARQSWLQWYPPEVASCGRDIYGMIENFPLQRAIPMIFKGAGDCSKVDWSFLGGSIANWAFVWFCAFALVGSLLVWRRRKQADADR
jgi:protein dithiol:quinone oxidoreductase